MDTLPVNPFTSNEIDYHGESLSIWLERLEQVKKHQPWERKNGGLTFDAAIRRILTCGSTPHGTLRVEWLAPAEPGVDSRWEMGLYGLVRTGETKKAIRYLQKTRASRVR